MTPKKPPRPNMKQVYFTDDATAIISKMPKGEASRAISAAVVAMYAPDDHQRRMAVLAALLYDAEFGTLIDDQKDN